MSKRAKSNIMLFITAFIWGSAFVAQKVGAELGTFTFNGITGENMTWSDGAVNKDPKGMIIKDGAYVGLD